MFWLKKYKQAVCRTHKSLISVNFLLFSYFAFSTQANVATIMDKSLGTLLHFLGAFSNAQPLPSIHKQSWTRAYRIRVSTLYRVGGENCKTISKRMHCFMRELQKIMNTALSQGPLSTIVVNPQPYF